jgi:hypothetical protein
MLGVIPRSSSHCSIFTLPYVLPAATHLGRFVSQQRCGGTPARLGYYDNYLVDSHSCVIVGVEATGARMSQETVAAEDMLTRFHAMARTRAGIGGGRHDGEFLQWLAERNITPYMRTRDNALRKNNPGYGPERVAFLPESHTPASHYLSRSHTESLQDPEAFASFRHVRGSRGPLRAEQHI